MVDGRLCGRVREGWVTYAYLLLYIALSSGQIFFNKWVLSSKEINFPYPVALTLLHMVFSSVLCFVLIKVFKNAAVPGVTMPSSLMFTVVVLSAVVHVTVLSF